MAWNSIAAPDLRRDMILFDGDCVLCSRAARFVDLADGDGLFAFLTTQSEAGRALAERFGVDPDNPQTNIVVLKGRAYFKSDAMLGVLAYLPRWRAFGALRRVPKAFRDWCYDRIARNRYRLFGRRAACLTPGLGMRARFIERADQL